MSYGVRLSEHTFNLLRWRAREANLSLDDLADEVLARHLEPSHAYVEVRDTRSGPRSMIRGTQVPVSMIVGYIRLGKSPEAIAGEVLPRLSLAQVYDALSYYYGHRTSIDRELEEDTEAASMGRLRERLEEADYGRLMGQAS